jgi:hypothetical protein
MVAIIVHNNVTMCHAQQRVIYLQGQGLTWRSKINIVCFIDQRILKILGKTSYNNVTLCHAQHLHPYLQGQGHT